ncbi:hypothetical protein GGI07_001901 [Coemansia sp. Benny D115]|nr:hypothetical protein GGI07_001901 [Coemansia sp. Benny D115]
MANGTPLTAQDVFTPPNTAETVIFYISLVVNLTSFIPLAYAIWFRDYPPMKAQHVGITLLVGIGGIIFSISNNLAQGMAKYNGVLGNCDFWGGWALFTFGLALFSSSINMRLILFYRVFVTGNALICNRRTRCMIRRFWPLFALWFPSFISSMVISTMRGNKGAYLLTTDGLRACVFEDGYLYWIYAYFAVMIIVSWIMYFFMRKYAKTFNGFRMAVWTLVIFTFTLIINMAVNLAGVTDRPLGRIIVAVANMVLINGYIWLILGPPVIGHMFFREQTMRKFMNTMHKDTLVAQQTRGIKGDTEIYADLDTDPYEQATQCCGDSCMVESNYFEQKLANSRAELTSPTTVHDNSSPAHMI